MRAFRLEVERRVFHALMAPAREAYGDDVSLRRSNQFEGPLWSLVTEQPMHMLPDNYDSWNELLLAAVRAEHRATSTSNFRRPAVASGPGARSIRRQFAIR